jgi:hypothetical protein
LAPTWLQFKLQDYGLFSGAAKPDTGAPYWRWLEEQLLSRVSSEERAELQERAESEFFSDPATMTDEPFSREKLDLLMARLSEVKKTSAGVIQQSERIFRETTDLQYAVSRRISDFEKTLLTLNEGVTRGLPDVLQASEAVLEFNAALSCERQPITGAGLLRQWEAIYRSELQQPLFLHEENTTGNIDRHRASLDQTVKLVRDRSAELLQIFDELAEKMGKLIVSMRTTPLTAEAATPYADEAEDLRRGAWFLLGEGVEAVSARVEQVSMRRDGLIPWAQAAQMDRATLLRAFDTWDQIYYYDFDTLNWLRMVDPALRQWIEALRPKKTFG